MGLVWWRRSKFNVPVGGSEDERRNDLESFLPDDERAVLMVILMSMFVD